VAEDPDGWPLKALAVWTSTWLSVRSFDVLSVQVVRHQGPWRFRSLVPRVVGTLAVWAV
jgi:hypothetical protein